MPKIQWLLAASVCGCGSQRGWQRPRSLSTCCNRTSSLHLIEVVPHADPWPEGSWRGLGESDRGQDRLRPGDKVILSDMSQYDKVDAIGVAVMPAR